MLFFQDIGFMREQIEQKIAECQTELRLLQEGKFRDDFRVETNISAEHLQIANEIEAELKKLEGSDFKLETGFYKANCHDFRFPGCLASVSKGSAADAILTKTGYPLVAKIPGKNTYMMSAEPCILEEIMELSTETEINTISHNIQ